MAWSNETYTKFFPTENEFNLLMAIAKNLGDGCDINDAIRFTVMTTYQAYKSTVGHPDAKGESNGQLQTTEEDAVPSGDGSIHLLRRHMPHDCNCGRNWGALSILLEDLHWS
jgi:hypothetical protein